MPATMHVRNPLSVALALTTATLFAPAPSEGQGADQVVSVAGFTVEIAGGMVGATADSRWEPPVGGALSIANRTVSGRTSGPYFSVEEVTLSGPAVAGRLDLLDWIDAVQTGKEWRRAVTMTLLDAYGNPIGSNTFLDAFPVRYEFPSFDYSSPGDSILREKVVFRANALQSTALARSAGTTSSDDVVPRNFTVEINGAPTTSSLVLSVEIDPIEMIVPEPKPVQDVKSPYPTLMWSPGKVVYGNVTLEVYSRPDNGELPQWWTEALSGHPAAPRSITVRGMARDMSTVLREWRILDCLPVRYSVGKFGTGSAVTEVITCQIGRVELL